MKKLASCEGYDDVGKFVRSLKRPRKLLIMVEAGKAVDEMITALLPHLQKGCDVIIDGGNSYYKDTERRITLCSKKVFICGLWYFRREKRARLGPAIMPGGAADAYELVKALS